MKLIANMGAVDQQAISEGIAGTTLMDNAGRAVFELLKSHVSLSNRIAVVCGRGNNGGDGFVVARYLLQAGYSNISVFTLSASEQFSADAKAHFDLLSALGVSIVQLDEGASVDWDTFDWIVDAMYGTGLSRPIAGFDQVLIHAINQSKANVLSIDTPSGIDSLTGRILGSAIQADITVTLACPKPGLYLNQGKAHTGQVHCVDIGIPTQLIEADPSPIQLMTPQLVASKLPRRQAVSHKYTYGHVLVIAGCNAMPGAGQLACEAALRSGAGLVTLASPQGALDALTLWPELLRLSLPGDILKESHVPLIQQALSKVNTLVIGPGLGQAPETQTALSLLLGDLLTTFQGTLVLDADALNYLATAPRALHQRAIITPHLGEAARLLKTDTQTIESNLLEAAEQLSVTYAATVVLKSASTVVATSDGAFYINPTGNPGMATAGSGDVLSGIIGGLCAQGLSVDDAAAVGVYLHALSGDIAAQDLTEYALIAGDITEALPDAYRFLLEQP